MAAQLKPGMAGRASLRVAEEHTAPRIGSGAEVVAVEGRKVRFRVEARDERERIGDGVHERVVVNVARFDERIRAKHAG